MNRQTIWDTLKSAAIQMKSQSLRELFNQDPNRAQRFSLTVDDLFLDYSKNFINPTIMEHLISLAELYEVKAAVTHLFAGKNVNTTEKRPALHWALRAAPTESILVDKVDIIPGISLQKAKMAQLVNRLRQRKWRGATGQSITDVVNLGIGGSDLGPRMVVQALQQPESGAIKVHFVSNIDPCEITHQLKALNPATTLFLISSKSFSTPETLTNAQVAKEWLINGLKTDSITHHFIAITSQPHKAQSWGIAPDNVLTFAEWVGGRYSVWSPIGFPIALVMGMENFEQFLQGARAMDRHFAEAPLAENMPVILALIGIWYIYGFNATTLAVLPYAYGLRDFPDYLQQLDMESNGKSITTSGHTVAGSTGPIVWGQAGTNGQHAFYQLLHQGTHFIPIDFILTAETTTASKIQHQQFVANGLAQAQALMEGTSFQKDLPPHEHMPGNRPSSLLLLSKLTPYALGQLLALYEHKIYVQGVIWQINSFDQPGVELGKKLANNIQECLCAQIIDPQLDGSTQQLLKKLITKQ